MKLILGIVLKMMKICLKYTFEYGTLVLKYEIL